MMLNFTPLMVVAVLLSTAAAHAQELTGAAAAQKVEGAVRIRMNVSGTAPDVVLFDPSKAVPADKIADLQRRLFGNRPDDSWTLIRSEEDKLGMVHARYQQRYKNREVEGCVYIFHAKGGKIVSAGGDFVPRIDLSAEPVVTEQQAIAFAAAGMKEPIDPQQADQTGAELVVLALDRQPVLAYRCTIFSRMPLVNRLVYVDAHNGNVLREVSLLCSTDVPGTAHTQFSGVQPIVSDQVLANQYVLRESGRGIETFNNATMQLYADGDNSWNNVNPSMDEFATDVHFGAEVTRDFFYYNFGRDSYDNNGGIIRSYVNDEWVGVNAYWSGGVDNTMHYGTGDADYYPVASLDVAGHELSHGVTEYSAGLQYFGESGALNESFSDIFGNTIRFLSAP